MPKEKCTGCQCDQGRSQLHIDGIIKMLLLAVILLGGIYIIVNNYKAPNIYTSAQLPEHAISVSASATQNVVPDLLVMQISVKTEDTSAKKSQEDNAAISADLRSRLKGLGLKEEDIRTTGYSVEPVYNSTYVCNKDATGSCRYESVITGYSTTQEILLNLKQLDKGGDVIDAASTAGVNQTFVDSVSFTLQDATRAALEKALLKNASIEAKSKAQNIANGLGISVGKVLSASQSYEYYPRSVYSRAMALSAITSSLASSELSPGQLEVSVTVSASFEVQ